MWRWKPILDLLNPGNPYRYPGPHNQDSRSARRLSICWMLCVRLSITQGTGSNICFDSEPGAARIFPYFLYDPTNTTVDNCLAQCSAFGYNAAGLGMFFASC